MFASAIKTKS